MSPIPKKSLLKKFILLEPDVTLEEAGHRLINVAGSELAQWYIVVRLPGRGFSTAKMNELVEMIAQKGTSILSARLEDIPDLQVPHNSIEINSMGLGAAERELYRSPKARLVILDNEEPVGLLTSIPREVVQLPDNLADLFSSPINRDFKSLAENGSVARFLNVCLTNTQRSRAVERFVSLAVQTYYFLRVDIGQLSPESVIVHPVRFPDENLPASQTGWWLEAIAASDEFKIAVERHHFFLPRQGPSWVCHCQPGKAHVCSANERQRFLFIPVTTPAEEGHKTLRLTIYFRKNVVQSLLLTAEVARAEKTGGGYQAQIDFSLTTRLDDMDFLPKRSANILMNQNMNGTHSLIYNGQNSQPFCFSLSDNYMQKIMEELRDLLNKIHYSSSGLLGHKNNYDRNNAKSKSEFIADLAALAETGWELYDAISNKVDLAVNEPGTIQIARAATEFVFPWAFVYDISKESFSPWKNCRLIEQWDGTGPLLPSLDRRCPFENEHTINTLCPYGFWGYRHLLELPPSINAENADKPKQVINKSNEMDFVFIQNTTLDPRMTSEHVTLLEQTLGISFTPITNRIETKTALDKPDFEIVYFYVHGKKLNVNLQSQTSILVGNDEEILPGDIKAWYNYYWRKDPEHWRKSSPLIFINGCHTTDLIRQLACELCGRIQPRRGGWCCWDGNYHFPANCE